jgi:hypothetical protein
MKTDCIWYVRTIYRHIYLTKPDGVLFSHVDLKGPAAVVDGGVPIMGCHPFDATSGMLEKQKTLIDVKKKRNRQTKQAQLLVGVYTGPTVTN